MDAVNNYFRILIQSSQMEIAIATKVYNTDSNLMCILYRFLRIFTGKLATIRKISCGASI